MKDCNELKSKIQQVIKYIIIVSITVSTVCFADDTWYFDTAADPCTADGVSYDTAYPSLNAALQAKEESLKTARKKVTFKGRASTGVADTTAAAVDTTWDSNSLYYVTIECEDSESTGRHSGIWSNSCYRLTPADTALTVSADYTVIDGLQIKETNAGTRYCITITNNIDHVTVKNTIMFNDSAGSSDSGVLIQFSNAKHNIYNCIFYDFPNGILFSGSSGIPCYVYNCTFHNMSSKALSANDANDWTVENCIFDNCVTDTLKFADPSKSDYNSTTNADLGYTAAAHDLVSQTHPFNNPDGGDFSLTSAVAGLSDPASGLFSTDIAGRTILTWDRGAWDFITAAKARPKAPRVIITGSN